MVYIDVRNDDILKYAIENDIIDVVFLQEKINMQRKEEILRNHKYKIWQSEKDNRWRTYLPDDSCKNGRKLIVKSNKEKLENAIVGFYDKAKSCDQKSLVKPTITSIYKEWLDYKKRHTTRSTYIYRLDKDWERFYKNEMLSQEIITKPIDEITKIDLDNWAHEICKKYSMTKKCYYNMSHIIRNILDYSVDKGIIKENLFQKVKFRNELFKKKVKPKSETQVFSKEEEQLIIQEAYRSYENDPDNILYMMIPIFFYTGLRLGELSALEWKDVHDDYILVHQMYGREVIANDDGEWIKNQFKVVDGLKLNAEPREVLITPLINHALTVIKNYYADKGIKKPRYVFTDRSGKLPHPSTVDSMFYRLCDRINISHKSPHKTRKTYISTLIDGGINIDFIREQVGHNDEKTTYESYCFNRATQNETQKLLNKALS